MEKEKIHVTADNVSTDIPNQNKEQNKKFNPFNFFFNGENYKMIKLSRWLGAWIFIGAVALYIILGCTLQVWSKAWMIFIFIPVIPSIFMCLGKKKFNAFAITFLVTGIYCAIGMNMGLWHPTWVIFFAIPIYHLIAMYIDKRRLAKQLENLSNEINQ